MIKNRLEKLNGLLDKYNLDGVAIMPGPNMHYLPISIFTALNAPFWPCFCKTKLRP
jgi:hypothetical protein